MQDLKGKTNILYVFGGEQAQGAEIVIERLMCYNSANVDAHLLLSPGRFADQIRLQSKSYSINTSECLRKLYRSKTGALKFYLRAVKNYFALSWTVHQYIKTNNIDVVHANTVVPASYLLPLIWSSWLLHSHVKWVWSDHDIKYFARLDHLMSKLCVSGYDRTLAVSGAVIRKFKEIGKIRVLYNGLDINVFNPNAAVRATFRKQWEIQNKIIVIGMPAVVTPRKGQLELIRVFNRLEKIFPDVLLLLAGGFESSTPAYSRAVEEAVQTHQKILHLGFLPDMVSFYNGCDIVINNSTNQGSEPLGTSIYEAMACEKLVIASDTGGTREIIDHKENGILFSPENEQDLEKELKSALGDVASCETIRTAARLKVEHKFNIAKMANNYNSIINNIIK
jgi:glycosyltransferase involved in cell wall biosynthesis